MPTAHCFLPWHQAGEKGPNREPRGWGVASVNSDRTSSLLHDTPERSASDNKDPILDNPCHQLPAYQSTCPVQSNSLTVAKTNSDILPPQKKTKRSQKLQGRGLQGCQQQGQASQKESTLRQQERKKAAALANRLKSQRPEECLKHIIVVLDPGPPSICLHPLLSNLLSGPPTDSPFPICCSAFADGRWGPAPRSLAVHGVLLCD